MSLLEVRDLVVELPATGRRGSRRAAVRPVDGVSFSVAAGEAVGLVGESGCGKSTLARAVLGLVPVSGGTVRLDSDELTRLSPAALRKRRARMQLVFQDPLAALDPRMTVGEIVAEPLTVHRPELSRAERSARVAAMLERVGLAATVMNRYPHQFSGGQCQRIGIARALVLKPDLVICDEPVSALDLSVRAQILALLSELRQALGLSLIFIAHDLGAVRQLCQRVLVMYAGRLVECAETERLFMAPSHPYTRALLSASPPPDPARARAIRPLPGEPPSLMDPPSGCRFRTRCPLAVAACAAERPALRPLDGTQVACLRAEEVTTRVAL
ncbi:MAG: ATP-binding cassette domain-containing protein [Gammaproteobacteria bacterium]